MSKGPDQIREASLHDICGSQFGRVNPPAHHLGKPLKKGALSVDDIVFAYHKDVKPGDKHQASYLCLLVFIRGQVFFSVVRKRVAHQFYKPCKWIFRILEKNQEFQSKARSHLAKLNTTNSMFLSV